MSSLLSSIILQEGINHIEDLPIDDFINTVENIKKSKISEKLDGAMLWFGLDKNGLFTSREGKSSSAKRFYSVKNYPEVANYNAFRAAHQALVKVEDLIKKYIPEGSIVEIEVLYGRQPNTVTYGNKNKNFIVMLRSISNVEEHAINSLINALKNKNVTVTTSVVSSLDGNNVDIRDVKSIWEFTNVPKVNAEKIDLSEVDSYLNKFKKFLSSKNDKLTHLTNKQVAEINLTSVKSDQRNLAKDAREKTISTINNEFKLPIKDLLLNTIVRKIKPALQDKDLHPSEDVGVEGVVIMDPKTGEQVKLVDKDIFTAINKFNSEIRSQISGLVRSTDENTSLDLQGGIFGSAKIKIADLLGIKELALSSNTRKILRKFKSDSHTETVKSFAHSLHIENFATTKRQICTILETALDEINDLLNSYKKDANLYKLKLKDGREIGISPEIYKRNLTAFAETKRDIKDIIKNVNNSNDVTNLIESLYGKTVESIHSNVGEIMKEGKFSFMKTIIEDGEEGTISAGDVGGTPLNGKNNSITAASIAPVPVRLFNNKPIIRRTRTFFKGKKFKLTNPMLIKSINEDDISKDVHDNIIAKKDAEFKQLRNNLNLDANLTQSAVNKYLDKAHEINDDIDTVAFGLESSNGIVKVYVNVHDCQKFEEALANMLGKEDDIEEVINTLSNAFDIVDVEWPKSAKDETSSSDEEDTEIEDEDEASPDINLETETVLIPESIVDYENALVDINEDHLDAEAKYEKMLANTLKLFPSKNDKMIICLMACLGVPVNRLSIYKSELNTSITPAADFYAHNSSFRLWTKKLMSALNMCNVHEEHLDASEHISNRYQKLIMEILQFLGLPDSFIVKNRTILNKNTKELAKKVQTNNDVKIYLMALANLLNIKLSTDSIPENKLNEDEIVNEDFFDSSSTITSLLTALGFDVSANKSIMMQMQRPQVRTPMTKLASNTMLLSKLKTVTSLISDKLTTKKTTLSTQPPSENFTVSTPQFSSQELEGDVINEYNPGEKIWLLARMGNTSMLRGDGKTIRLNSDNTKKLINGFKLGKHTIVTSENKQIAFKPIKYDGFQVIDITDDSNHKGLLPISHEQAMEFVEMFESDE